MDDYTCRCFLQEEYLNTAVPVAEVIGEHLQQPCSLLCVFNSFNEALGRTGAV